MKDASSWKPTHHGSCLTHSTFASSLASSLGESAVTVMASLPQSSPVSSLSPPEVPMELHVQNRVKLVRALRDHLMSASQPVRGFVLLQGGEERTRYCTDHVELFRQESYFAYLFGVREPGFYGAIDVLSGQSVLFAPRLPAEYAVWLGEIKALSYFKERYMVDMTYFVDEIAQVLYDLDGESGKPLLFLLHGLNTDSKNFSKPAEFKEMERFETDLITLHPILTECRVFKSKLELDLIQYANDVSSEAHVEVMRKIRADMKEYQLESIFLHHIYMYGGCRHCSYTCVCATGENSAVLHYGHAAAPNDRALKEGDISLFDMGAEYHFYGSDITCSFPVSIVKISITSDGFAECCRSGQPQTYRITYPLLVLIACLTYFGFIIRGMPSQSLSFSAQPIHLMLLVGQLLIKK